MNFQEAKQFTIEKWQWILKSGKFRNEGCALCRFTCEKTQRFITVDCDYCPAFKAKLCHNSNPYTSPYFRQNADLLYWQIQKVQNDPEKMKPLVEELLHRLEALEE